MARLLVFLVLFLSLVHPAHAILINTEKRLNDYKKNMPKGDVGQIAYVKHLLDSVVTRY